MKEQERFEQYMRDRYGDISLDLDDERGWYAEIAVRFAWQAWQARTDLAHHRITELERKLGEARERELRIAMRCYNDGYKAGHHNTVESQYTDIFQSDIYDVHREEVEELLADLEKDDE